MNKKFLSAILFGALMVTSTGTFVSCKDYDDDIDQINTELDGLKDQIAALQSKINSGEWVSGVTSTADGVTITLGNGQTFNIKNGKDGAPGAAGAAGAAGSVITIDPTTNNWLIDGVDTGVCAKGQDGTAGVGTPGLDGHSPKINEAGTWEVWNDETQAWEDTELSAIGAQTYVVEYTSYYELNVMEQDAEGENVGFVKINLPKTAAITNLEAVTITSGVIGKAVVDLNYGKSQGNSDLKFNNKNYKNTTLLSAGSSLSAIVNPQNADASVYEFALVDSKGNAPYVISGVKANATEAALSRAATANNGVWDMSVAYAAGVDFTKAADRSAAAYALTTTTYAGTIASAYDVEVNEQNVSNVLVVSLYAPSKPVTESIDLINVFKKAGVAQVAIDGGALSPVADLTPYIVDYYFEIADKTAAAALGAQLNGNILTAEKPGTVAIKVNYLLVDGDVAEVGNTTYPAKDVEVEFTYVAPTNTLGNVEWTVNKTTGVVYLPLGDLQSSLTGASDTQLPTVAVMDSTWTDGEALDSKTVEVNAVKYGKDGTAGNKFASHTGTWITKVTTPTLYKSDGNGGYVAATASNATIQTPLYIKFSFDYETAFPGEYLVKLALNKGNNSSSNNNFEIPVNVTIKSPAETAVSPFNRLDAYFVGDDAVAYGTANGTNVTYDLFDLYKAMGTEKSNVTFAETKHDVQGHTCAAWITSGSTISVGAYDNVSTATDANWDKVYSTREIKATYEVFGNEHIANIVDKFNLTIKSEIAEGTLEATSAAAASGNGVDPIVVSLKNITAKDVYGQAYNLAQTYKYNSTSKKYDTVDESADTRLSNVKIILVDDNAKEYLKVADMDPNTAGDQTFVAGLTDAYSVFGVQKKSATTALAKDVECTIAVEVTDNWGKITTANVKITLKK